MKPSKGIACFLAALFLVTLPAAAAESRKSQANNKNAGAAAMANATTTTDVVPPPGMVHVPGGAVRMGSTSEQIGELKRHFRLDLNGADAAVMHELIGKSDQVLTVEGFFIDQFEVTNGAYDLFVKATKYPSPEHWGEAPRGERASCPPGLEQLPVVNVSYVDAAAYAMWAGKRVPTEIEWERAARGDDARMFPWGDFWDDLEKAFSEGKRGKDLAGLTSNGYANSAEEGVGKPMKVGSFPKGASPFGVMDMAGNVWEWTSSNIAPHPRGYTDLNSAYGRVIKGGSCLNTKQVQRTAVRMYLDGGEMNTAIGFRCVKSEKPGVDRVYNAYEQLRPGFPAGAPAFEIFRDTIAIENPRYDPTTGWPMGAESVGFCPIPSSPATDTKRLVRLAEQTDKLKSEILLGIFHTHRAIENLGLEPGDYSIFFQAKDSKAFEDWTREQKAKAEAEAEADKEKKEEEPAEPGQEDGKKNEKKKDDKKEAKKDDKKEGEGSGEAEAEPSKEPAVEEAEDEGLPPFTPTDRLIFKDRRGIVRAEIKNPEITPEDSVHSALEQSGLDLTIRMVIRPEFGTRMLQIRIPMRLTKPL